MSKVISTGDADTFWKGSALIYASGNGQVNVVEALSKQGVRGEIWGKPRLWPIHAAAGVPFDRWVDKTSQNAAKLQIIKRLQQAGLSLFNWGQKGDTVLHAAASFGDLAVIYLALRRWYLIKQYKTTMEVRHYIE